MKTIPVLYLAVQLFTNCIAQSITIIPVDRVSFLLKNTLNYSRMFRAEGPGMAYGFAMGKRDTTPCNWPIGSKLYFSEDGKANGRLITTVTAADEGKTITTDQPMQPAMSPLPVTFRLANKSLLPRKFTLIGYTPGETGNSTTGFVLAPKGSRSFTFPVGTKLYLANSEQVDVVMSGKRLDDGKPFWTVKKDDQGKVIHCN